CASRDDGYLWYFDVW
nr:immunoglobulin heavy chain junction region [Mus musculus]MBK4184980.1 immunoglobulin heavy chain junction region [Mus musculus]